MPQNRIVASPESGRWWFSFKLSLASLSCFFLLYILHSRTESPFPAGICRWVDCSVALQVPVKWLLTAVIPVAAVGYVWEKKMLWALLTLTVSSILVLSLEESNGNTAENGLLSLLFLGQLLAYLLHRFDTTSGLDLPRLRRRLIIQSVAAVYVLAGLSKLQASGVAWFTKDSARFVLEIMRVHYNRYVTYGDVGYRDQGLALARFMLDHPLLLQGMLGTALLLELGAVCLLLDKKTGVVYALLLLGMHAGMYLVLGIFFPTISVPLLIVFINPLYFVLNALKGLNSKRSIRLSRS